MAEWTGSFVWRGVPGCVASDAYGFPVCTAEVHFPRRGYDAMFCWVQLVRSPTMSPGAGSSRLIPSLSSATRDRRTAGTARSRRSSTLRPVSIDP